MKDRHTIREERMAKQSRIRLAAKIRFTNRCLASMALNNSIMGDRIEPSADIHNTFINHLEIQS